MKKSEGIAVTGLSMLAMLLVVACQSTPQTPQPMKTIESTAKITATVEQIDHAKRLLSLKSPSGEMVTVEVDPAVRNLDQMKVGDRVVATYREAIGAQIRSSASGAPATVKISADVAEPGERPAASATSTVMVPVTIASVDSANDLVSFYGEDGLVRAINVQTDEARAFIKQLKPGDHVEVTFTEAFAISVERAP
jgi:hypothetical protein